MRIVTFGTGRIVGRRAEDSVCYLDGDYIVAETGDGTEIDTSLSAEGCAHVINQALFAGGRTVLGGGLFPLEAPLVPRGPLGGQGYDTHLQLMAGIGNDSPVSVIESPSLNAVPITIENIRIDGNKENQFPTTDASKFGDIGIYIVRKPDQFAPFLIQNVHVHGCISGGIYVERGTWVSGESYVERNAHGIINHCLCYENGKLGVTYSDHRGGIHIDNINNMNISDVTIKDNIGYGVTIVGSKDIDVSNVHSSGNAICGGNTPGLYVAGSGNYNSEDIGVYNYRSYNDNIGVVVGDYDRGAYTPYTRESFFDVTVRRSVGYGCYILHADDCDFRIRVSESQSSGIKVLDSRNIRLVGNSRDNGAYGLSMDSSDVDYTALAFSGNASGETYEV